MFSNSDHEVTNLVQTNLPLSLLITTQTHADERNDEQQILSKDKIKYFIKNTSHLKICLFLSIFVAACVGPQSRHKGIVWSEGRTGEFLWSSWPLPHLARGDMHWRCTDALLSYTTVYQNLLCESWELSGCSRQETTQGCRIQLAVLVECCTAHYPGEWRWVAIDVITGTFYLIITLHPSSRGKRYTKAVSVSSKF